MIHAKRVVYDLVLVLERFLAGRNELKQVQVALLTAAEALDASEVGSDFIGDLEVSSDKLEQIWQISARPRDDVKAYVGGLVDALKKGGVKMPA